MEQVLQSLKHRLDIERRRTQSGALVIQGLFKALRHIDLPVVCIEVRAQVEHPDWGAVSWVVTQDRVDECFLARSELPALGSGAPRVDKDFSKGSLYHRSLAEGGRGYDHFWAWSSLDETFDQRAEVLMEVASRRIAVDAALLAQQTLNQTQLSQNVDATPNWSYDDDLPVHIYSPFNPGLIEDRQILRSIASQFSVFEWVMTPFWVFHPTRYQIVWGNRAARELWKADDLEALWRRDLHSSMSYAMAFNIYETTERIAREGHHMEWAILEPLGEPKRFCLAHHYTEILDGVPAMITEALTEPPAEQIVNLAANLALTLALFDQDGALLSSNTSFLRLMGERRIWLGHLLQEGWDPKYFIQNLSLHEPYYVEVALPTQRGERWFRVELRRSQSLYGEVRVLGSFFDITEQRIEQLELKRLATTDLLTGLANRHGLLASLKSAIKIKDEWTFVFLDLDGLKMVNDVHGHGFGDQILAAAGHRMSKFVQPDGFLGRMGGDEFLLVLPGRDKARPEVLRRALAQPFDIEGVHLTVTASLGIAFFPEDGEDIESLINQADMATLYSKRSGKNQVSVFLPSMIPESYRSRELNRHIRTALANQELRLVVQPIFGFSPDSPLRGECLMRWTSESLGVVSPEEFIPAAEEAGIMPTLGQFLVKATCRLLQNTYEQVGRWISLSLNVSAREFTDPEFATHFISTLNAFGIPRDTLSVELTETSLLHRLDHAQEWLAILQEGGVNVALDDFGTGYSSLSYLHQLPFNFIKLDRSLVEALPGPRSTAITQAVISLAKGLGARVIGEGVEEQTQFDTLKSLGCDYAQGYLLAKPLEETDWLTFTRRYFEAHSADT